MEKLRKVVNEIAYAHDLRELSPLHRSLVPILSLSSSLYTSLSAALSTASVSFAATVPVISFGNLTWRGHGKTPMVEFIALWLADSGTSPLILSRDTETIRKRLGELEKKFCLKPVVVVTEKDYDRDPDILKQLDPF